MLVAEHDRPVAAHQVDVLVPVHVPDPGAAAAAHELRVRGGSGPRWCPYIPPGITARHARRSCSSQRAGACGHVIALPVIRAYVGSARLATRPRLRAGQEVQDLAEVLDPGVRAQAGGHQRAAGRCPARPRPRGSQPSSSPASIPALKPSPQPVVSTTSTAIAGRCIRPPVLARRPGSRPRPRVTATPRVPEGQDVLDSGARGRRGR